MRTVCLKERLSVLLIVWIAPSTQEVGCVLVVGNVIDAIVCLLVLTRLLY